MVHITFTAKEYSFWDVIILLTVEFEINLSNVFEQMCGHILVKLDGHDDYKW
jgi:hypothetical protein